MQLHSKDRKKNSSNLYFTDCEWNERVILCRRILDLNNY